MLTVKDIGKENIFLGPVEIDFDRNMRGLCKYSYPGHPKGCPNFNKKASCPPIVKEFLDVYESKVYVCAIKFDFANYLNMMKQRHPEWTDRQLANPLYWQGHVDTHLKKFTYQKRAELIINGYLSKELMLEDLCPSPKIFPIFNAEAMGVNMTSTLSKVGIDLEWPPKKWLYKVALIGVQK